MSAAIRFRNEDLTRRTLDDERNKRQDLSLLNYCCLLFGGMISI